MRPTWEKLLLKQTFLWPAPVLKGGEGSLQPRGNLHFPASPLGQKKTVPFIWGWAVRSEASEAVLQTRDLRVWSGQKLD